MSEKKAIGIKPGTFKMGDLAADGGMGTSLTALPDTVKGSFIFEKPKPSAVHKYANGRPRPVVSMIEGGTVEVVKVKFYDISPATTALFFGGDVTAAVAGTSGAIYESSNEIEQIEQSFEWTTKNDVKCEIVRGLIVPGENWSLNDDGVYEMDVDIIIMEPEKADTPAFTRTMPTPVA